MVIGNGIGSHRFCWDFRRLVLRRLSCRNVTVYTFYVWWPMILWMICLVGILLLNPRLLIRLVWRDNEFWYISERCLSRLLYWFPQLYRILRFVPWLMSGCLHDVGSHIALATHGLWRLWHTRVRWVVCCLSCLPELLFWLLWIPCHSWEGVCRIQSLIFIASLWR